MYRARNIVLTQKLLFNIIDKVVDSDNLIIGESLFLDCFYYLGVGRRAENDIFVFVKNLKSRNENEH